eukprot:TRINITY_DN12145_c0_g2_i2.p1 TRINITY_DN12145_c0_g2~~TRINITY_DN12145_c0_g2_i2.p1  ORF type:complete len:503 (-),score=131.86 TRINITY_DN12145_c0_g2_i2:23-1531(-)
MAEKAALQVEAEEKSCEHGATNPANTHSLDDEQHERILQNLFESSNAQEVLLHFDNDWLDALLSVLNDSQYVPISGRKFLLCLVETFGSVCDQLSPKDLENLRLELSKKTSANPYLSQNIRRDALLLLNSCKAFLLRKGYEEEPHGLWCKNGSLTQKVLDILNPLKKANMIESFRKVSVGNVERIIVIGAIDQETFMKKMEVLGANSDKISLQLPRSDESFRFGDPFHASLCCSLDFVTQFGYVGPSEGSGRTSGRWTAGGIVELKHGSTCEQFVCTVAHVAFSWLAPEISMLDMMRFNSCVPFAGYLRHLKLSETCCFDLDFAFVRLRNELSLNYDPNDLILLADCDPGARGFELKGILFSLLEKPVFYHGFHCRKTGITTGETHATFSGFDLNSCLEFGGDSIISAKGDSGALWLMLIEDIGWVPVGIHYNGVETFAGATFLLDCLFLYCLKNGVGECAVRFLSPLMDCDLMLDATDFERWKKYHKNKRAGRLDVLHLIN